MHPLKRHPFGVTAHFEQSLVLTYAVPREMLTPLLPPPFTVDGLQNGYGFIAVAMVQTQALRPTGMPAWLGQDFFLAGYRIFVHYVNKKGKRLRGLYILESQTDSRRMEIMGNLMTHYNYQRIGVEQEKTEKSYRVTSADQGFSVTIRYDENPALPQSSCFGSWKDARFFAGPLPFTFTYDAAGQRVLMVQGVRQNWKPRPVTVEHCTMPWFERKGLGHPALCSAFVVQDIPYHWKKGVIEQWQP